MDVRDHKPAVVVAAAVDLEDNARPFVERRPVLAAGLGSSGIPHYQLRPGWEVEWSAPRYHETSVA